MRRVGILVLLLCVALAAGCSTAKVFDVRLSAPLMVSAQPGDRVFVDVKNVTANQNIALADQIRADLQAKGYTIAPTAADAQQEVHMVVRYTGLVDDAVSTGNILKGAGIGGLAGGLGGLATGHHHWRRAAGGAVAGAAAGAGIAWLIEEVDRKSTFVIRVDAVVKNKHDNSISTSQIQVTIGEKSLTEDMAIMRAVPAIALQVTGLF